MPSRVGMRAACVLAVALALAALSAGTNAAAVDGGADGDAAESRLTLHLFDAATVAAQGTRCLDGSPSGFYYRPSSAADGADRWAFFLEGGGECYTSFDCPGRMDSDLGSSKQWAPTHDDANVVSRDAAVNPVMATWNHVYMPYCSQDVWLGMRGNNKTSFGAYFAGRLTLETTLKTLAAGPMANASVVVMAGASAGAAGVFGNLDSLATSVLPKDALVLGAPQGGWFYPNITIWPLWLKNLTYGPPVSPIMVDAWHPYLPAACLRDHSGWDRFYCMDIDVAFGYITTPMLVAQNKFDAEQLYYQMGVPYGNVSGIVLKYIADYAAAMDSSIAQVRSHQSAARGHGLFYVSCMDHTDDLQPSSDVHVGAQQQTYSDVLAMWLRQRLAAHATRAPTAPVDLATYTQVDVEDKCDQPDLPCNKQCTYKFPPSPLPPPDAPLAPLRAVLPSSTASQLSAPQRDQGRVYPPDYQLSYMFNVSAGAVATAASQQAHQLGWDVGAPLTTAPLAVPAYTTVPDGGNTCASNQHTVTAVALFQMLAKDFVGAVGATYAYYKTDPVDEWTGLLMNYVAQQAEASLNDATFYPDVAVGYGAGYGVSVECGGRVVAAFGTGFGGGADAKGGASAGTGSGQGFGGGAGAQADGLDFGGGGGCGRGLGNCGQTGDPNAAAQMQVVVNAAREAVTSKAGACASQVQLCVSGGGGGGLSAGCAWGSGFGFEHTYPLRGTARACVNTEGAGAAGSPGFASRECNSECHAAANYYACFCPCFKNALTTPWAAQIQCPA